ncbi:hypothetical protein QTO34_001228 [Cnephaeus nilssonii]|uniref:G-protein coupled receptors family 1 profile domain-containing protein n=1 Tax=Cnephaeus nilssonii TaxID=3371016 RepID=A0AA40HVB4_CNENI|nr:hypothetical protein QTO34_001228 [Eptesicus nilssonii]
MPEGAVSSRNERERLFAQRVPGSGSGGRGSGGGCGHGGGGSAGQRCPRDPWVPLSAVNPWDVLLCVSGTVIAGENALVVALIASSPALRTPMFVLVGSLATADLLAGCGLILHFVFQYVVPSETVSLLTVGFLVSSFAASVSSLLAITVDRYLSLYNALTYYSRRTLLGVHLLLAVTWTLSLGLGLLPVLGWNCLAERATCSVVSPLTRSHVALLSATFFVVFGIMLHLYVRICQVVWRHRHQIALQQHCLAPPHLAATRKGVGTLAVVLGTFGLSWLPFAIYCVVGSREDPAVYTYATLLPATYNSMINPIIMPSATRRSSVPCGSCSVAVSSPKCPSAPGLPVRSEGPLRPLTNTTPPTSQPMVSFSVPADEL